MFLRYLSFSPDFYDHGKRSEKKVEVSFKVYDVTNWITTNWYTRIAQYLKTQRLSDYDIWSVNIM